MANPFLELRRYIKSEALRLKAFTDLDELLGEGSDLTKLVNDKRAELTKVETVLDKANTDIATALNEAVRIREKAEADAKGIIKDAEGIKADAQRAKAEADALVVAAEAEAQRQVAKGREDAVVAAADATGLLGQRKREIAEAEDILGKTNAATDNAKARLDELNALIEAGRKRFG